MEALTAPEYRLDPEHPQFSHMSTLALMYRLHWDGVQVRRELHACDADSRYVVANAPIDVEPTTDDMLVDMSLWQRRGILYLPRTELMERLTREGVAPEIVSLYSLETIVKKYQHDIRPDPRM